MILNLKSLLTSLKFIEKYFFNIFFAKRTSKSSPPSLASPLVPNTLKIPSLSSKSETSNVPPPKS